MSALELKVYDLLKVRFNEDDARTVIEYIANKSEEKMEQKKDIFLTKDDKIDIIRANKDDKVEIMRAIKDDKVDIMRAIYATNLIQYLALIGSMIAIFHFMNK